MEHLPDPSTLPVELRPDNYQPNIITESKQEFSETEKRIVVLAINQLPDVVRTWKPGNNLTLIVPYSELTERHHDKIALAASSLNTKQIIRHKSTKQDDPDFTYITPFPRVSNIKINGKRFIELVMFAEVVPSFVELGKRYTRYSFEVMMSLSSTYAQRMYEILMMFYGRGQKTFTYEVDKLRFALNYPPEHHYYDFKRKALLVAQQEIAKKAGLYFEYEPVKKNGKVVVELRFEVKSTKDFIEEDVRADMDAARAMQPHEIASIARNLINDYRFTRQQQNEILQDFSLMATFIKLHTEIHHGKREVKNPTAYIAQSLGFGKPAAPKKDPKPAPRAGGQRTKDIVPIGGLVSDVVGKMKPGKK